MPVFIMNIECNMFLFYRSKKIFKETKTNKKKKKKSNEVCTILPILSHLFLL